jgi:CHAT domain
MQYSTMELELTGSLISNGGTRMGAYRVRVLHSPAGEMTAEQAIPIEYDDKQLQSSLDQLEQRELDTDGLIALGRTLAGIMLPPGGANDKIGVRELFALSLARIPADTGLRLMLRLPHELSVIPWEYMFVERAGGVGADGFLALDPRIAIVRYESLTAPVNPPLLTGDIKVVTAIAAPDDLVPLDLDREQRVLNEGLKGLDLIVQSCPAATLAKLQPLLAGAGVFHFAGHGDFAKQIGPRPGTYTGSGFLAFQDERVDAQQLAINIRGQGIRLAVLAACQTARRDGFTVWSGIAPALIKAEIPAVVANQYAIKDSTAIAFSQQFYQALAGGLPIERAVTAGRIGAYNKDTTGRDWGVPVLYMRAADGKLFEGAVDKTARERARKSAEAEVNLRIKEVQAGGVVKGADLVRMLRGHLAVTVTVSGIVLGNVVGIDAHDFDEGSANVDMEIDTVGPGGRVTGINIG